MEAMLTAQLHPAAAHQQPAEEQVPLERIEAMELMPKPSHLVSVRAITTGGLSGGVLREKRVGIGELVQPGGGAIGVAIAALQGIQAEGMGYPTQTLRLI
jgi:hypothetical protein